MPITHQIIDVPLVWVVQSTWLEGFLKHGAGMTDNIRFKPVKRIADCAIYSLINRWTQVGLLRPLNKAADHYGVRRIRTLFDYYHGDLNLVAEPPGFTDTVLTDDYRYIGPVIAREDFPVPKEVLEIPRDTPLVYFAMGSSGTPAIVAKIVASFEGKPYRVIAPVKSLIEKVPGAHVPQNVLVTGWLPALKINRMADIAVIHGGIGTVMTGAYAGKPIVGVGMQPEQTANLSAIAKKGFAIRIPKSKDPSAKILAAIETLLHDEKALARAKEFATVLKEWDGPSRAAQILMETYGK
jgi:UDP:flavonoid glycosyltransferase YjiC (YdhE family)